MDTMVGEARIWEAIRYARTVNSGRTRPLQLECEVRRADAGNSVGLTTIASRSVEPSLSGANVESCEFLVKALGHPSVFPSTLFRELFGNLLARVCGIITPEPALIALNPKFIQVAQPHLTSDIKLRPSLGVGCQYLPSMNPGIRDFRFTTTLRNQAALIYAFDLWTENTDRRINNPNCGIYNGNLIAYDFDCAFTPTRDQPWELSKSGIAEDHVFQNSLRDEYIDWMSLTENIRSIDEPLLYEITKDWPADWLTECDRIFDRLLRGCERERLFVEELERSLRSLS